MHSPKEIWLMSGMSATWLKIVAQESFEPACHHALMELQNNMPPTVGIGGGPTDPTVAMDANSRMHGAKQVLEILLTLSDPIKKPSPTTDRRSLHYE
jgi:hypothetical protein